jgi:hypothetical protein
VAERGRDFGDTGRLEGAVRAALSEDDDERTGGSR